MSNNYSDPDGQCMDDMNELKEKLERNAELYSECLRIAYSDGIRPIATSDHIRCLLSRIRILEQNLLNQANENQEPY